ncbi:MAG: Na(+)/H(+) antiporter subunit B [Myxococcaceae bacterium]|nr:Na(+)/H(+) antiporter subunit B [Myxococcaceae bacterium]
MNPVVLCTVARMMAPVLLLFSLVLTVRGHDSPGGGFVGGLLATAAFTLLLVAQPEELVRRRPRVDPTRLAITGLLVALGSGLPALFLGRPFLTGLWAQVPLPGGGALKLGTPQLFDAGVYLLVLGTAMAFILGLLHGEEEEAREREG